MKITYLLLAHNNPQILIRLIRALVTAGHTVALHYDKRGRKADYGKLLREFEDNPSVRFAKRVKVRWGGWSICQATLNALEEIAASGWEPDYVYYCSGSDFPTRSSEELVAFLSRNAGKEFIEGVPANKERWVKGGPQEERYQYRFWFNWREHYKISAFLLKMQQKFNWKRKFVLGLEPFMGAQWWVLTWPTLKRVMELAGKRGVLPFFRTTLIPDELFFQTLVCNLVPATRIVARPLTLYQFTDYMVPIIFCADRVEYLARQPFFMARKLSPHRRELYDELEKIWLGPARDLPLDIERVGTISSEYETHRRKYRDGAPGLPVHGKSQNGWFGDLGRMELPFFMVAGLSATELKIAQTILSAARKLVCHGQVFHPDQIELVNSVPEYAGFRRNAVELRNTSAPNFLANLVRAEMGTGRMPGFLVRAGQGWHVPEVVCNLAGTRVLLLRGDPLLAFAEHLMGKQLGVQERIDWNIVQAVSPTVLARKWHEFLPKFDNDLGWLDKLVNTGLQHKGSHNAGWLTELDLDLTHPSRLHRQGVTRIRADLEGWSGMTLSRWRDWMVSAGRAFGVPLMNQLPAAVSRELTTNLAGLEAGRKLMIDALDAGGVTVPEAYDPANVVELFPEKTFIHGAG